MSNAHGPDPLLDSLTSLVAARALITATSLGIFDALAEGPLDPDGLAARLELDPLGAETLLTALLAMRYVELDEHGAFRNSAVAERRLVKSSPDSIATFVGSQGDLHWEVLGLMTESVRTGDAYAMHETRHEDAANWEAYMRGLHEISRDDHAMDAKLVPVEAPRRLVDIAGGHGGFSMAMCRRHPQLAATIVDLPPSAAVGRKIVAEQGFADRVSFREGDVFDVGLGTDVDVVSSFNLVHHLSEERNRELCRMARQALRPGGCLVIGDAAQPEAGERTSDRGAISSLLFYTWSHSRNFRPSEIQRWMQDAGFVKVSVHRNLLAQWRVVVIGR
ncbi:MAG TPA: methyltransferase [Conexibacter sp.]|jgi:cyclopropane fatty-acyl-phospholipid synthase-like methyltransferase|nr:methyltransferase [Conexibacter sp.]